MFSFKLLVHAASKVTRIMLSVLLSITVPEMNSRFGHLLVILPIATCNDIIS